jgi:MFS transporter, DHA2 family, methylenomycin A resistance protein
MTVGTRARQRLTLTVACLAQRMMVLDVLIVSVALPAMQRELHLSPAGLEWVVSGYALALAALIPTGGALGDHFGRKRIFVSGVTVFTLASVGCALSVSGAMLVGFRVIQGIGGAVMSSLTLSLISEAYPPEARTGPLGVSTVVICLAAVRESREPVPRSFDIPGVALSASGLLLLTFGFVESSDIGWHSPVAAVCVAGGIVVLAVFVAWERRAAAPMVPLALLRTRGFGWACSVYLLAYLAFSGFIYYVTLFFCIPYFVVAQLGKRLARWLPVARAVGSGCFIAAAGVLGMSQLKTTTPFPWPAACYIVVGVGFGLMVPAGSLRLWPKFPGIIRDRLGPVQLLSPDRHGNGAGDLGIRRRRCDLGRMASACRIFPADRTAACLTARC